MIFLWIFCGFVFLLGLSVFVGAPLTKRQPTKAIRAFSLYTIS